MCSCICCGVTWICLLPPPFLSFLWSVIYVHIPGPPIIIASIMLPLAASSPPVIRAVDPQSLLQLLLLEAVLHGVHQVVDAIQGPHG